MVAAAKTTEQISEMKRARPGPSDPADKWPRHLGRVRAPRGLAGAAEPLPVGPGYTGRDGRQVAALVEAAIAAVTQKQEVVIGRVAATTHGAHDVGEVAVVVIVRV